MHDKKVAHRDLSYRNLMFSYYAKKPLWMIFDYPSACKSGRRGHPTRLDVAMPFDWSVPTTEHFCLVLIYDLRYPSKTPNPKLNMDLRRKNGDVISAAILMPSSKVAAPPNDLT